MTRLESDYYSYMGFDPSHNRDVVGYYLKFFEDAGAVLELAPGRGEFLCLLKEKGIEAQGVDIDEGMVDLAKKSGLEVALGDAVHHVEKVAPSDTYGGVFASHFLEHLTPESVERLAAAAHRVLRPGGRLVAVVPNPACYAVLTHDFWRDPTHERFYDIPLLEFLFSKAGLTIQESGGNPKNAIGAPPGLRSAKPVVHPPLDEAIEGALRHSGLSRLTGGGARDRAWAHLVKVLAGRLTETEAALADLQRGYSELLETMYQPNEIYVVARK